MTPHHPPRLALALLDRFVPDSEPLAGDLVEQFEMRPSRVWFWMQVLGAIGSARRRHDAGEIRPLRLVDLQPAEASERTRRYSVHLPAVTVGAAGGVGALGLGIFAGVMTGVVPSAWWLLLGSAAAGCALAVVWIVVRNHAHAAHVRQ